MSMCQRGTQADIVEALAEPWVWHFLTWIAITVHLGLLLSAMMRYGGMLIAVAMLWIAAPVVCAMGLGAFATLLGRGGAFPEILFRYMMPMGFIVMEVIACIIIQRIILSRVELEAQR